jgi:hypothetical protein
VQIGSEANNPRLNRLAYQNRIFQYANCCSARHPLCKNVHNAKVTGLPQVRCMNRVAVGVRHFLDQMDCESGYCCHREAFLFRSQSTPVWIAACYGAHFHRKPWPISFPSTVRKRPRRILGFRKEMAKSRVCRTTSSRRPQRFGKRHGDNYFGSRYP